MKIGIIGFGRFGKLWSQILHSVGMQVLIYDRNILKTKNKFGHFVSLEEVVKTDILFLLVPISEMENICKKIKKLLPVKTIVIDACSVKIEPVKIMKRNFSAHQTIVGTHPLFGPDSIKRQGLKGQKIVICKVQGKQGNVRLLEKLFDLLNLKIIKSTPKEHDREMSKSQVLVHFLGRALGELGLREQSISTPDYQSLLKLNDLVNNDTWQLFFDMQRLNPFAKKMRKKIINSLIQLDKKI